jgi:hypothetical protein
MRLARRVAAGLVLGALIGFLAALLRPRNAGIAARAGGNDHSWPAADPPVTTTTATEPSPTVIKAAADPAAVPPATPPQPVTGGIA